MLKIYKILFLIILSLSPAFALESADYSQARELYEKREMKRALRKIDKIEQQGGMNAEMALLRYEIYRRENKVKEAKHALNYAVKYDKSCYEAYIALAIFDIKDSNPKLAKENFEKAMKIYPELGDVPDISYYFAKICIMDKDFDLAKQYILKAMENRRDEPVYYLELGKIYLYKKDYLKAVNAFEFAINEDIEINAEAYNYLGLANYGRDNFDGALKYFKKAVEIMPSNIVYLNNLALCYKSLKDNVNYQKTINLLENITPNSPEDYIKIFELYSSKNNFEMARNAIKEGLLKYPDNLLLKDILNELNKS